MNLSFSFYCGKSTHFILLYKIFMSLIYTIMLYNIKLAPFRMLPKFHYRHRQLFHMFTKYLRQE